MAKIGYFIVCEDVFNDGNEFIIKKPYNAITPISVPGNFSFVISFSLFDLEEDKNYNLTIEVIDPDGTAFIKEKLDFQFTPPNDNVHSGSVNLKFNNVVFEKAGIHIFKVSIEEESKDLLVPVIPTRRSDNVGES